MTKDIRLLQAFPTPILCYPSLLTEEQRKSLVSKINKIEMKRHDAMTGDAGSTHTLYKNINNILGEDIVEGIKVAINEYAQHVGLPPLILINTWVNIQNKGSVLKYHTHPNSEVSGALYINVGEDSGKLTFRNPNPYAHFQKYVANTQFSNISTWIKPNNGDLILFPSWLEHGSFDNNMDGRICVSFNTVPSGFVRDACSLLVDG